MSNQTEVLLWLDSPVTKAFLRAITEQLENDKNLLTRGHTLTPGAVEITTARIVGKIEVLDMIANHIKSLMGVVEIEEESYE